MEWRTRCIFMVFHLAQVFSLRNGHIPAPAQLTDKAMSCDKGWYTFGDKCYRVGGNKKFINLGWMNALEYCKRAGGTLATVSSKAILEFLTTFLVLDIRRSVWIGLSDTKLEVGFYWEDETPLDFTNWAPGEPSNGREHCVEMQFNSSTQIGYWNTKDCGEEIPFICQKNKTETAVVRVPLDPKFCSEENNSGWKFRTSCFNLVTEKKSWRDAEKYCRDTYSGHLATLRDVTYDIFIEYMLKTVGDVWIGIVIEVNDPPVLKQSMTESACPEDFPDWKDLGGDMCYFFEVENEVSWFQASFMCLQRGGSLVSIHSQAEVDVLHQFVLFTKEQLHIGLHRKMLGIMKSSVPITTVATQESCTTSISISTLIGIVVGILLVEAAIAVIWIYYFKLRRRQTERRKSSIKHVKRLSSLSNSPKFKKDYDHEIVQEDDYYEPMT
ncbi:macrophage mannose receptor 1-like [Uloborus diversus]|uniref:macrophage mannose receptor 1-like n=1 Tax=Uloborus diversus TaxID=327109 RepID=UPI00240974B9|nr:macrophage mannose receptor 1-like [Uloborus diversus]